MKKNISITLSMLLTLIGMISCQLTNSFNTPSIPDTATALPTNLSFAGDLGMGNVHGIVTDAVAGTPLANVNVTCEHFSYNSPEQDRCNRTTVTDSNGNYIFKNIFFHDTDQITITVESDGYNPATFKQTGFTYPDFESNFQMTQADVQAPPSSTLSGPVISNCPIFPGNNFWNARVDTLPVHPLSDTWINHIGRDQSFHMDFGSGTWDGGPIGIPFNIVAGSTVPKFEAGFYYPDESDPGPYPIPQNPTIEYGSDHHILTVDTDTCTLYEIYDASFDGSKWSGGSGAVWDLSSNALRPADWTSADAAGLPILPGLARYDEIAAGAINHALRFTVEDTAGYIWPARHLTADAQDGIPPMGARFRLKADYDISGFPRELQVILQAMKTYGIVLADNGSNWYVSGAPDERWDNDMLHLLDVLTGNDFEAVDTSGMRVDVDSGDAK
ncbi:MAG: carboxypeptidase regulatory-like domain-containing protein [Chloroflexi bacterium]|nr:carboxypeptidase regulatory-like domain-containing protein [Chloroflexota bacterium]